MQCLNRTGSIVYYRTPPSNTNMTIKIRVVLGPVYINLQCQRCDDPTKIRLFENNGKKKVLLGG